MRRKSPSQGNNGTIYVHVPQLAVWSQKLDYWVGRSNHYWHQAISKRRSRCGTFRKNPALWMRWGVQIHPANRQRDSHCSFEGSFPREVPSENWKHPDINGWQRFGRQGIHWKLAVAQNHRKNVRWGWLQTTWKLTQSEACGTADLDATEQGPDLWQTNEWEDSLIEFKSDGWHGAG